MSFDLKTAIASIAPTLATMLGGPLAGTAVSALASAFGLSPTASQDDITKVIQNGQMTPEIIAKVRGADQKHAEIMAQQGIDLQKLNMAHEEALEKFAADDRESARKRQELTKDDTPAFLAFFIIAGFFIVSGAEIVGLTLFPAQVKDIPPQGWLLIGSIAGYLAQEAKSAAAYYFGTTAGSSEKTKLLAKAPPVPD